MRICTISLCCVLVATTVAPAQDDRQPTTEWGITITPDQLDDAIQETQDFWGPVKKHIASGDFAAATPETRQQAVAFLKRVHDELYQRLFERDEATAQDLLDYVGLRLRKFVLYRQLRETMGDDAAFVGLWERWERAQRDIHSLPEADRAPRVKATLALLPDDMSAAGMSAEKIDQAMKIWEFQAQCMSRMAKNEAGKTMLAFDRETKKAEPQLGELVRAISAASDWTLITKNGKKSVTKADFIKAWEELAQLKSRGRTASKPVTR